MFHVTLIHKINSNLIQLSINGVIPKMHLWIMNALQYHFACLRLVSLNLISLLNLTAWS